MHSHFINVFSALWTRAVTEIRGMKGSVVFSKSAIIVILLYDKPSWEPRHIFRYFVSLCILSILPLTRELAKPNTKIKLINLCFAFGRWWCPGQLKTVHDMCCSCQLGWLIYCNTVLAVGVTPAALASWPVCPICALPFFTRMPSCLPCTLPSISYKKNTNNYTFL